MFGRKAVLLFGLFVVGCGGSHVVPVENTNRASIVWQTRGAQRTCLEFSTAVAETSAGKVEIGAAYAGASAKASSELATGVARIYSVSDILQFGHASLFRLCEAYANGVIDEEEWRNLYVETFEKINRLLSVQVDVRHAGIARKRVETRQKAEAASEEVAAAASVVERAIADLEEQMSAAGLSADELSQAWQRVDGVIRSYRGARDVARSGSSFGTYYMSELSISGGRAQPMGKLEALLKDRKWLDGIDALKHAVTEHNKQSDALARLEQKLYGLDSALDVLLAEATQEVATRSKGSQRKPGKASTAPKAKKPE